MLPSISRRELSYLLVIMNLSEESGKASISKIAKSIGVSPPSAYEEVNHLEKKSLVEKDVDGVTVTNEGRKAVSLLLSSHRIIETWLKNLGFTDEEACNLASQFDEYVPIQVVERLFDSLGKPSKCPHGLPIESPSQS
ncbi:DtxR family iron (metal) dependent repressor [Thermocladium modestius]|uniref:DtxR family iron (Metal) dependent repressor n=1 Tax=Thermocladium modestius TaxID=62609 RepID=A0A830GTH1_9CREN|nr:metal-dependent transcriptional regulator [Thermocladium modestius]GGP18828.1 DtxR family iron (metal) dependent repressor [Thermocladium modestius]